ncbi:flagellar biosynthesis, cell-distal portion of basal-body rod [Klebsiella pneumoniae]|nr:flagellar biosynthesis, cell-distal portion of basal-body rod [Klebsiella pneumoniae]
MTQYNTGNPVPSSAMPDVWDNNATIDEFVNSPELTLTTRTGTERDTLAGIQKKSDDQRVQMAEDGAAVVEETRQNLIPLSRQYMTLAAAQADIVNIPAGSTTYVRSVDDNYLADEYVNNAGTLEATGRKMISAEYVDALRSLITQEVAKIMASGAAAPLEGYPDVAWAWVDKEGKSTTETLSDGTTNLAALLLGNKIEFVTDDSDGVVCQLRGTTTPIFSLSASGVVTFGQLKVWVSEEEFLAAYKRTWMDSLGNIYKVEYPDGSIEDAMSDSGGGDASEFPMVSSVDGNIIAVDGGDVTQITNDTGISNIAPVAFSKFLRFLSNISGSYLTYRSTYDGNYRARESFRYLIHVILTGQSLAAGGSTQAQSPVTTSAQADYGILAFGTGPKVDFKYDTLNESLLGTVIPCRENVGTRPGQESPSSGMAFKIHELTGGTVLVSDACSSGTAIADISSGTATFTGATKMIQAAVSMAEKLGMQYVPVMVLIHGNQNAAAGTSISSYRAAMETLRAQYESVINAATGESQSLHMFVGQLSNIIPYGGTAGTTRTNNIGIAQYQEARDNALIHLASAQYARPYSDGEHLTSAGYRTEGEVIGAVVGGWLNDNTKSSLVPIESGVVQSGNTITIPVAGCVGNLVIDTARVTDPGNYGFVLTGATIASVSVSGSGTAAKIVITKTDSTTATAISYASQGIAGQNPGPVTGSRGCIRDSQPGSSLSGLPLYNDLAVFSFAL